jgi:hypothetical protein
MGDGSVTIIAVDVSSEFIVDGGLGELVRRHGLRIVGSDHSETAGCVRLLIESEATSDELEGKLVKVIVHQTREGASCSTRLEFEAAT